MSTFNSKLISIAIGGVELAGVDLADIDIDEPTPIQDIQDLKFWLLNLPGRPRAIVYVGEWWEIHVHRQHRRRLNYTNMRPLVSKERFRKLQILYVSHEQLRKSAPLRVTLHSGDL